MMKYRPDIDALRGIAVLSVFLFHLGLSQFSGGFVGVDIFFVISGYVIAMTIEDDLNQGKFSILRFYNKRIRRIFPALFTTFAVTFVAGGFLLLPHLYEKYAQSLVSSALFVSNMFFWKDSGYFSSDALTRPLLHTWSLSVEEQYYIFFPIFVYLIFHYFGKRWLISLLPVFILSLGLSIYATSLAPTANFFLLPTRTWELLTGAILALRTPPELPKRWMKEAAGLLGITLIAIAIFLFDEDTPFPGLSALLPCGGAALIIYGGQSPHSSQVYRFLANKVLLWFGLVSYSLYLIHWPSIVFFYLTTLDKPTTLQALVIFAVASVLAYLSWRFVEQPFRSIDPSPANKKLVKMGLLGMAIATLVGGAVILGDGFKFRYPDFTHTPPKSAESLGAGVCFFEKNPDKKNWNLEKCTITHNGEKALLWGDSFAAHYVPGIRKNESYIPYSMIQYTAAGCPPILSYTSFSNKSCTTFNAGALDVIRENSIQTVVLSARWNNLRSRGFEGLQETIDKLKELGVKQIYVIGQSPEFSIDVNILSYFKGSKAPQATDSWSMHIAPDINQRLSSSLQGADFIDPLPHTCSGNICAYRENGVLLYGDYGHYSEPGSDRAVRMYFPLMKHDGND